MNAAPFSRMLWKEYRSLRMLWVGCTLGTFFLWGVMFAVTGPLVKSSYELVGLLHALWSLSLWLPAVYLLGCTVATFAGEREERTADWLVNLAFPFRSTFAAKILWTVLSAAAMQLLLLGAAALIRLYYLSVMPGYGGEPALTLPGDEILAELPRVASFALLEALAWGLFWSLQSSKPMTAAIGAAICLVAVNMISSGSYQASDWDWWLASWGVVRTLFVLAVLIADVVLARRWLAGQAWEWSIPWDRFIIRRKFSAAAPPVEPSSGWRRAWQRFRWLEWQSLRIFFLFSCVIAVIPVIFVFNIRQPESIVVSVMISSLLPYLAGLGAWQGEQSQQHFRFFVQRGISPLALWINKFGQWLLAVFLSAGLLFGVALLAWNVALPLFSRRSIVPVTQWFDVIRNLQPRQVLPWEMYFWCMVTLFAGAFAVNLYFRRTIFAFAAGWVLQIALFYGIMMTYFLRLPTWLGVLPITVWLIGCSLRQLPRWYLEITGWRTKAVIAAEWLVFPVIFSVVAITYWVDSVPMPDVERILARQTSPDIRQLFPNSDAQWKAASSAIENLCQTQGYLLRNRDTYLPDDIRSQASDEEWTTLEPGVLAVRDRLLAPKFMTRTTDFHKLSEQHHQWGNRVILHVLMQGAQRMLAAGKTDESVLYVRAAVRLAGAVWTAAPLEDPVQPTQRRQLHADLHGRLVEWAQHPKQTPQVLVQALTQIEQMELRWWRASEFALEADYRRELAVIKQRRDPVQGSPWTYPPWVAAHDRRLAACRLSNRMASLSHPATSLMAMMISGQVEPGNSDRNRAWNYREVNSPVTGNTPAGLDYNFYYWRYDSETRLRCTMGLMAVVAFRQAHGRLPTSLDEISPEFGPSSLWQVPPEAGELQYQADGNRQAVFPQYYPQTATSSEGSGLPYIYVRPSVWGSGEILFPVPPLLIGEMKAPPDNP